MIWKRLVLAALCASLLLAGCAHGPEAPKTAQELYDEAVRLATKGDVEKAADAFMKVRTYHPSHELARRALLATGDLYYDKKDYESAMKSYQEYRMLYPTDKEAGYCLFRIGMCHFNQMSEHDRDQGETVRAVSSFDSFLRTYPGSPHVEKARECLKEARKRLAQNMLIVGRFYLRKGNLQAACARFRVVGEHYGDVVSADELEALVSSSCSTGPAPHK
jgi:outer membrane protein assembly factor BamD